ncbi:hypothetical protein J7F03_10290 [Streptomyces sp. ISL-43]|uniref:hypothetical protein n=1 Tax=Streptomyces sp. ISL-43 TaxID=2819183 RepID=UPI001BEBFE63|nr:hypothetical protein [Streptomyces sp. ISL-43]MBT2447456.1 hypothetical protein [Streptomyces sp. ISL-43]
MEFWQYTSSEAPLPQLGLDPYRFPGADTVQPATHDAAPQSRPGDTDWLLPPFGEERPGAHGPASDRRLGRSLTPMDRRRLDLQAALTTAGIPPLPGDVEAIYILSALDDTTHAALVRWITTSH